MRRVVAGAGLGVASVWIYQVAANKVPISVPAAELLLANGWKVFLLAAALGGLAGYITKS